MTLLKESNPKDAIGATKMPLDLVSGVTKAYASIAQYLGAVKYGAWNFRVGGVRASIYRSALDRHMDRWYEGEELDPSDGTPHLANALACINILIEAKHAKTLIDDRPPSTDLGAVYAELEPMMAVIKAKYAHLEPVHHTQATQPTISKPAQLQYAACKLLDDGTVLYTRADRPGVVYKRVEGGFTLYGAVTAKRTDIERREAVQGADIELPILYRRKTDWGMAND